VRSFSARTARYRLNIVVLPIVDVSYGARALKDFVYRPGFILDQSARTIRSSYRMRLLVNILGACKHVQNHFSGRI